jgi:hypothetical protein
MFDRLDRLSAGTSSTKTRVLWAVALITGVGGVVAWAVGLAMDTFVPGVIAMWCFCAAGIALAWVLRLEIAIVMPLFMGVVGWLVDMLPFVMLVAWFAVVLRWLWGLVRERRWPRGGRWVRLPIGLTVWTALGAVMVLPAERKHFVLLFGIQVLASATVLLVAECLDRLEARRVAASGLLVYVIVCAIAVFLQWTGIPVEGLQDERVSGPVEESYGVNAFVNSTGMIKYERAKEGGAGELRNKIERLRNDDVQVPEFSAFRAPFKAFDTDLVVRFAGSAREIEDELAARNDIELIYDNVGLAPGNEIPRMRAFPRNALTFAGVCAAVLPLAFFLLWAAATPLQTWIARLAIGAGLFGIAFSLARGAWGALAVGLLYLVIDGALSGRRKVQVLAAVLAAAVVLTGTFLVKYDADPLNARAGAEGSIGTREALAKDTFAKVTGVHILLGYGSEKPRDEEGNVPAGLRYIPEAGTHSTYLNYLFRTGVPGLLMLLGMYVAAWFFARRDARRGDGETKLLSQMLAMTVVIVAAHGIVLSLFVEPVYTLTASIVLGLAAAGVAGMRRAPSAA